MGSMSSRICRPNSRTRESSRAHRAPCACLLAAPLLNLRHLSPSLTPDGELFGLGGLIALPGVHHRFCHHVCAACSTLGSANCGSRPPPHLFCRGAVIQQRGHTRFNHAGPRTASTELRLGLSQPFFRGILFSPHIVLIRQRSHETDGARVICSHLKTAWLQRDVKNATMHIKKEK
jgi:hypothetical protein